MGIFDEAKSEYEQQKATEDAEANRRAAELQEKTDLIAGLSAEFASFARSEKLPKTKIDAHGKQLEVWLIQLYNEAAYAGVLEDGTWTVVIHSGPDYGIGFPDRNYPSASRIEQDFKEGAKKLLAERDKQRQ